MELSDFLSGEISETYVTIIVHIVNDHADELGKNTTLHIDQPVLPDIGDHIFISKEMTGTVFMRSFRYEQVADSVGGSSPVVAIHIYARKDDE